MRSARNNWHFWTSLPESLHQVTITMSERGMGDAPKEIKIRHMGHCMKAEPAYGEGVARALGISMSDVLS